MADLIRDTSANITDSASTADIFSPLLDLESQFYSEGYTLGVRDGASSGRVEGRIFGLEKGFEKFVELGRLRGRAMVWREQAQPNAPISAATSSSTTALTTAESARSIPTTTTANDRLQKHVTRLLTLTDPTEFSTLNTEDYVNDVDERLRDAKGKVRIVSRILGEREGAEGDDGLDNIEAQGEEVGDRVALRVSGRRFGAGILRTGAGAPRAAPTGEMEDFVGLPGRHLSH